MEHSLALCSAELDKYKQDWDGELQGLRKERELVGQRMHDLVAQNEKLKIEGTRQVESYKSKY